MQLNQTIKQIRELNAVQTVTIDRLNDELRQKDKQIRVSLHASGFNVFNYLFIFYKF